MGNHLARLVWLALPLGGCSLLYDPSGLRPATDARPPPVTCESLTIERVYPTELLEGQGVAGSRSAVLIVSGQNIAAGATAEITPHDPAQIPKLTADKAKVVIDRSGNWLAVPVTLDVDMDLGASSSIRLDVTVSQPCASSGGTATFSLKELGGGGPALTLRGLGELTGTASVSTALPNLYSRVDVTKLTAADAAKPLIIRSTSSITIGGTQPVSVSAMGSSPGAGGFAGGNGGDPGVVGGAGNGSVGGGPGGGIPNGGGAGFSTAGGSSSSGPGGPIAGDAALVTLESPNRGSGGAGGKGAAIVGGARGGVGGGGGGSIELTAAGDLTVMVPIEAKGGDGVKPASGASSGGGGSGGVVLLRAGGALTLASGADAVTVVGGLPGNMTDSGAGAPGRIRVDSPNRSIAVMSNPPVAYRGPMFAPTTPMIVTEARPRLTLVGQQSALVRYTIEGEDGATRGPVDLTLASTGETMVPLALDLFVGYNRICALVTGVVNRRDEAENCITLAYLRPE